MCSRDECVPVCVPVGVRELTSVQANAPRGSARLQQLWVWESLGYSAVNSSQSHKDKVNGPFSSLIWPLETITFHTEHYDFSAALIWIAHSCSPGKQCSPLKCFFLQKWKSISNHVNELKHFFVHINALVLELGYNPSLMAHSPGHYRVMPSSGKWLHAEQWLCLALGRWCQDSDGQERDWGRGLCCQEELAGLWNIPFAEGNEEIPRRPVLFA